MHEVNINQDAYVKLTNHGKQVHKDYHDELLKEYPHYDYQIYRPKEDEEGWSQFHLWELMSIFGPKMWHGSENCFDLNIKIEETL